MGRGSGLEAAGNAELAQDVGDVHAGRFLADVEGSGDLSVGQAVAERPDDLAFPWGQAGRVRFWRRGRRRGQVDAGQAGQCGDLYAHRRGRETARDRLGLPCRVHYGAAATRVAIETGSRGAGTPPRCWPAYPPTATPRLDQPPVTASAESGQTFDDQGLTC